MEWALNMTIVRLVLVSAVVSLLPIVSARKPLDSLNITLASNYCQSAQAVRQFFGKFSISRTCAPPNATRQFRKIWLKKIKVLENPNGERNSRKIKIPKFITYGINLYRVSAVADAIIFHMVKAKRSTFSCPSRLGQKRRNNCNKEYKPSKIDNLKLYVNAQFRKLLGDIELPVKKRKLTSKKEYIKKLRFCANCKKVKKTNSFVNKNNWNERACALLSQINRACPNFC